MRRRTRRDSAGTCPKCFGRHDVLLCEGAAATFDPWVELDWEDHEEAQALVRENPGGMTLEDIGKAMGITRERVRQIESQALEKLQKGSGDDIVTILGRTFGTPNCERCGTPFVREGSHRRCASCRD